MTYISVKMTEKENGFERVEEIRAENEETALDFARENFGDICEGFRIHPRNSEFIGRRAAAKILDASETALLVEEPGTILNVRGGLFYAENRDETRGGWYKKSELEIDEL